MAVLLKKCKYILVVTSGMYVADESPLIILPISCMMAFSWNYPIHCCGVHVRLQQQLNVKRYFKSSVCLLDESETNHLKGVVNVPFNYLQTYMRNMLCDFFCVEQWMVNSCNDTGKQQWVLGRALGIAG